MVKFEKFVTQVSEAGKGWTDKLSCMARDKSIVPAEISASLFENEGKKLLIAMVRDMSEFASLRQKNIYLQNEVQSALGEFVGHSYSLRPMSFSLNEASDDCMPKPLNMSVPP